MEKSSKRTNRSRIQIVREIFHSITRGANTPNKIIEEIHLFPKHLDDYFDLIMYIQSQPKLIIARSNRYRTISLDSTRLKNGVNQPDEEQMKDKQKYVKK